MQIGKLSLEELEELVFSKINFTRPEVIKGAGVGFDCAELDMNGDIISLSTDPITASEGNIGSLLVNVCANDIAASGAENVALVVTMIIPPSKTKEEVGEVFSSLAKQAQKLGIAIIGGHTEVSTAVNKILLCATAIGRKKKKKRKTLVAGDLLYMSKTAGLEGTAVIINDKKEELKDVLTKRELKESSSLLDQISVVEDGALGEKCDALFMHDATEGGVLGAAYEVAQALGMGIEVYEDKIPILPITKKLAQFFHIDPLRLISSGVMLIAIKKEDSARLENVFANRDIPLSQIGIFNNTKEMILFRGDEKTNLLPPKTDEIYKI